MKAIKLLCLGLAVMLACSNIPGRTAFAQEETLMCEITTNAQNENIKIIELGQSFCLNEGECYQFVPEKSGYFTFYDNDGEKDCGSGGIYDQNMNLLAENSGGITGYWSFELTMYFEKGNTYYLVMDSFETGAKVSSVEDIQIEEGEQKELVTYEEDEILNIIVEPNTRGLYRFSQSNGSEILCDLYDITESECITIMQKELVMELKKNHAYKISIAPSFDVSQITMPCVVQLEFIERIESSWNGSVASGFSGGDGSENLPYQIKDASELAYLAKIVNEGNSMENKHIELLNDIVLNDTVNFETWEQESPKYNWIPIGMDGTKFEGIFDGNGHTVSGMFIENGIDNIGLFGILSENAWVKNLNLKDSHIKNINAVSETSLGGIAASNYGKIIHCNCAGKLYGIVESSFMEPDGNAGSKIGAIAGENFGTIQDSSNGCAVTNYKIDNECYFGYEGGAGGLVGVTKGFMLKCHNESEIMVSVSNAHYGRGNEIGGIVGCINEGGAIVNCWNTGNITGFINYNYSDTHINDYYIGIGGITGDSVGEIVNCYNTGQLEIEDKSKDDRCDLKSKLGGIVGDLSGIWSTNESWIGSVYNCYNIGSLRNVETDTACTGEITGTAGSENSINYSYWLSLNKNCCGDSSSGSVGECSAFDKSQQLEKEILAVNNLCEVLNKWIISEPDNVPYAKYCVTWEVREDKNNGYPVLSDTMPEVPDSLSVNTMPNKTEYLVQENFDKKGLTLTVSYISGKTEIIEEDDITIDDYDFSEPGECMVTVSYQGKKVSFMVQVKEEHTHTYISAVISEPSCTEAGIRTYTCSECGDSYTESIPKSGHSYQFQIVKATLSKNGSITKICMKCAEKTAKRIYVPRTIVLSKVSLIYNNKNQQPSVTVKDSKGKALNNGTDYSVTYPKSAKNIGQYIVTIRFKGNYSGTVKKAFTIVPKGTSISKITSKKKGFTVKWKKQTAQTTGYEIAYSTDIKFKKKSTKIVPIGKNKTTSKSVSKLKEKKKYYVRIRTYKTVKGKKYYSDWSKVKTVTAKK